MQTRFDQLETEIPVKIEMQQGVLRVRLQGQDLIEHIRV